MSVDLKRTARRRGAACKDIDYSLFGDEPRHSPVEPRKEAFAPDCPNTDSRVSSTSCGT
jgi:hypothetical protein